MMSGINWGDIACGDKLYSMSHLHRKTEKVIISGRETTINFTFGFHVFTNEKGEGRIIKYHGEERYFCLQRYNDSFSLVERIIKTIESDYVTSFISKKKRRRYYHINSMDDFILMEVRIPQTLENTINLNVVTAYTVGTWGDKSRFPRGENRKFSYILEMKLRGKRDI